MNKINYGIDAPKVIRNLIVLGILLFLFVLFFPTFEHPVLVNSLKRSLFITGFILITLGIAMLLYSKFGKFKQRDRILNIYGWKGDEKVLDVGTGSGLLMIGVAKKLTSGKAYGIDIFSARDLSNNNLAQLKSNTELEKVSEKVFIVNKNILENNFESDFFDVILSNLCIHNIPLKNDRKKACEELFRILKPGGKLIISDFIHISEYKKVFKNLGMKTRKIGTYYFDTFPPLTIITAQKIH